MELRASSYYALAALIDGPLHGYAIIARARELSNGEIQLSTGTLYGLLGRAVGEDLIVAGDPYVISGRERRDYELTPAGREALRAEAGRLTRAGRSVRRRLQLSGAGRFA